MQLCVTVLKSICYTAAEHLSCKLHLHVLFLPACMSYFKFVSSHSPSISWSLFHSSMYFKLISPFVVWSKPPSANVFLSSFNKWQTSSNTWTNCDGSGLTLSQGSQHGKVAWWSIARQGDCTNSGGVDKGIHWWCWHALHQSFRQWGNRQQGFSRSHWWLQPWGPRHLWLSSTVPQPRSTYPWNLPAVYSTCFRMATSYNMRAHTVSFPSNFLFCTWHARAENAGFVKPGSAEIWLYHVRMVWGWGSTRSKTLRTKLWQNITAESSQMNATHPTHSIFYFSPFWRARSYGLHWRSSPASLHSHEKLAVSAWEKWWPELSRKLLSSISYSSAAPI